MFPLGSKADAEYLAELVGGGLDVTATLPRPSEYGTHKKVEQIQVKLLKRFEGVPSWLEDGRGRPSQGGLDVASTLPLSSEEGNT